MHKTKKLLTGFHPRNAESVNSWGLTMADPHFS